MSKKQGLDAGIFVIALFLFFALKSGLNFLWELASLPTLAVLQSFPFSLADILAFVMVLVAGLGARSMSVVQGFGQEVVLELSKVTWPAERETALSTGVVLVMMGIASLLLFVMDSIWGTLTKGLLEF